MSGPTCHRLLCRHADELATLRADNERLAKERDEVAREAFTLRNRMQYAERAAAKWLRIVERLGVFSVADADEFVARFEAAEAARDDALAQVAAMRSALETIEQRDTMWVSRAYLTPNSIIVEDDGRHYNVRILAEYGNKARAALPKEPQS